MTSRQDLLDRIAQLEEMLGLLDRPPVEALLNQRGLSRTTIKMLGLLARMTFVPRHVAYDAIYGEWPESKRPSDWAISNLVKLCRRALRPLGVEIKNSYGEGWFIEPDDKKKLLVTWPELKRAA
jgi:hypothetical protein